MDELFGHVVRKCTAVALRNEVQHHVKSCSSSGARVAIAVDDEDIRCRVDARKLLGKRGQAFPMQRAAAAVEQTGARKYISAQADCTDRRARAGETTQPLCYCGIAGTRVACPCADKQ